MAMKTVNAIPKDADLARDEEADGDGRIDVAAADVSDHPDDRRHAEPERQREADDVAAGREPGSGNVNFGDVQAAGDVWTAGDVDMRLGDVAAGTTTRAARDEDEQQSAEQLGQHSQPEPRRLDILQAGRRHLRGAVHTRRTAVTESVQVATRSPTFCAYNAT